MFKLKDVTMAACLGFVLSFLISIISTHKGGVSFTRALIFALVFAVVAVCVSFLSKKFLGCDENREDLAEVKVKSAPSKNKINIVIDDENFSQEDLTPSFDVSKNSSEGTLSHDMFVETGGKIQKPVESSFVPSNNSSLSDVETSPVKQESPKTNENVVAAENGAAGFKPVSLEQVAGKNHVEHSQPQSISAKKQMQKEALQEIDSLPDVDSAPSSNDDSGPVIRDSEFAKSETIEDTFKSNEHISAPKIDESDVPKGDTVNIARAIQTLLSRD